MRDNRTVQDLFSPARLMTRRARERERERGIGRPAFDRHTRRRGNDYDDVEDVDEPGARDEFFNGRKASVGRFDARARALCCCLFSRCERLCAATVLPHQRRRFLSPL